MPLLAVNGRVHELVGDADAVVGVLEEDRAVGLAVERAVVAGVDERPGLLLFVGLAGDEFDDVGMIGVEDHHLGRPPRLAARLDHSREGVVALHERHRSGCGAAAVQDFFRGTERREVRAGAGAVLEQHAFGLGQVEDRFHGVLDRVDEAGRALGIFFHAEVEPHGAVEGGVLMEEEIGQFVREGVPVLGRGEVYLPFAPSGEGFHDPGDELPHAVLALRGAHHAAEILGNHYVDGQLRPGCGTLDALLLEHHLAAFAGDERVEWLPFHGGEGINPLLGMHAAEPQALGGPL